MKSAVIAVMIMAAVTYLPRVLPIAVFSRKIQSRFIQSFLYYIPFAVLGAMTFPSILFSTSDISSALIGTGVALMLGYFGKGIMTVATCAVIAVYVFETLVR